MSVEASNLMNKKSLRAWAKAQSTPNGSFHSKQIHKFIKEFTKPGDIWGAFSAIQSEPVINWSEISDLGLKLCYPKVTPKGLQFFASNKFEEGAFNIPEPSELSLPVQKESINGFFIPGLAFDSRGQRLGRGHAFYDQFLKNSLSLKVGLTWNKFFIQGAIPTESWDVPMDFILTENFIYQPLNSERLMPTEF